MLLTLLTHRQRRQLWLFIDPALLSPCQSNATLSDVRWSCLVKSTKDRTPGTVSVTRGLSGSVPTVPTLTNSEHDNGFIVYHHRHIAKTLCVVVVTDRTRLWSYLANVSHFAKTSLRRLSIHSQKQTAGGKPNSKTTQTACVFIENTHNPSGSDVVSYFETSELCVATMDVI